MLRRPHANIKLSLQAHENIGASAKRSVKSSLPQLSGSAPSSLSYTHLISSPFQRLRVHVFNGFPEDPREEWVVEGGLIVQV